jgi:hypothetical protein
MMKMGTEKEQKEPFSVLLCSCFFLRNFPKKQRKTLSQKEEQLVETHLENASNWCLVRRNH